MKEKHVVKNRVRRSMLTGIFAVSMFAFGMAQQPAPVKVSEGLLQGTVENGLTVYRGIPFAAPPVGDLRWKAPQPPASWDGIKMADKFAPAPIQGGNPPSGKSEDCLYLNIWTPAKSPKAKIPVLVWIYGGGFSFGSNSEPVYSGEKLAQKGVVLVSIAYRVGALAFLAHPELSAENPNHVSGNYGLLDMIAALRWIQKNIGAFGGDPGKVTIFGESAGGISVSMLCASPLAKGLFHGAISQSGGSFGPWRHTTYPGENVKTLKQAEVDGEAFVKKAGVNTIEELRKLDANKLPGGFGMGNAWPIVDGYVIPDDQCRLYESGRYNDVPVLIGYNSDEGASFSREKTPEEFIAGVKTRYGKFAGDLLQAYPVGPDIVPKTARDLARDAAFGWHTWIWANLQSQTGKSKVFYYYFDQHPDYPAGSPRFGYGSPHGQDIAYVFGHLDKSDPNLTNSDIEISEAMSTYWTNFARYGDPNGKGVPEWPAYSNNNPQVMYFRQTPHLGPVPDAESLKVLDSYFRWRRTPEGEAWGMASPLKDKEFEPTFESLEKADPVPEWFMDAKFGIYFHWGVYSVPAYANEWYPRNMYISGSAENRHHQAIYGDPNEWPYSNFISGAPDKQGNYVQFAPKLKSQGGNFDPAEWAQLFADAGARFAGPVAEHHDGFSMWDSRVNPWNAKDMGPKLDLVGLLTDAIREKNMKVILSMHHAYNITGFYDAVPPADDPGYKMLFGQQGQEKNETFWLNKHKEIIDNYKPDIIWQDFNLHRISQTVLLQFLAYYYNKAAEWDKKVVATYKDGLNTKCAVLDYERGGPTGITENYWLTDDAISSSSWCYTVGIGYYSKNQVMHGFLDRISKNGNLLLNISPMADGSIPGEQKDLLLTIGSWLKKYGEAVYATRAWEKYGEGPTRMGAAHGVMGPPSEGTAKDIRFTRSKDNTTLYAILLGWDKNQKQVVVTSLSSDRISLGNLKSVELINGEAGNYLPLNYKQEKAGLIINLPVKSFEEPAYVIKFIFDNEIPALDKSAEIDFSSHYYLVPDDNPGNLLLGSGMIISKNRMDISNQWKIEPAGKGFFIIRSRENITRVLACSNTDANSSAPSMEDYSGKDSQLWKIENSYLGLFKISNRKFPSMLLATSNPTAEESKALLISSTNGNSFLWNLMEVCEKKQEPFLNQSIPGTIEAEDFDKGCQEAAFYDSDEFNEGGAYRQEPVDIEKCSAGTFNVGWTKKGEWLAYTVNIKKSAVYNVTFFTATNHDYASFHIECDGTDKSGVMKVPNTSGYQNWGSFSKSMKLESGQHVIKLVIDDAGLNIDKIVFEIK